MAKIYTSIEQLVGKTPLLELTRLQQEEGLEARILAKIESFNPAGSSKDRVAKNMIDEALAKGLLKEGGTIIEPTSGNTGIGLAAISAVRGFRTIIVMPDTMSVERQKLIAAYGAELVLTDGNLGMQGAIDKANELNHVIEGSIVAGQFTNPDNPNAHYKSTGPEIWTDTDGEIDIFVATVGTGGTLSGTAAFLKEQSDAIQVVAVEPSGSPVLSEGHGGSHGIQGIGAGFIPDILDTSIYNEVITISDEDAYATARRMGSLEGLLVGISSGAALHATIEVAKRPENKGKTIVTVLPDSGERYLSTELYG